MSTKLKAGTSTSGAVLDADTAGILELQTGSTPTTAVTVDASQNVGIGTASPAAKFEVTGGGNGGREPFAVNGTNATDLYTTYRYNTSTLLGYIGNGTGTITSASASDFGIRSQNALAFATGGATERMRLDSSGRLFIGTTTFGASGGAYLQSVSNGAVTFGLDIKNLSGTNTTFATFTNSSNAQAGSITQTGATSVNYGSGSDYRLKENISPITNALSTVSKLNPVTFDWIADKTQSQGFIAHELQAVAPDCVVGEKDEKDKNGNPKYQMVDASKLIATLTAAIQELNAKVTALEAQLGAK